MVTEERAREIALSLVPAAEADDNKIAAFGASGLVLPGVADAAKECCEYADQYELAGFDETVELHVYLTAVEKEIWHE